MPRSGRSHNDTTASKQAERTGDLVKRQHDKRPDRGVVGASLRRVNDPAILLFLAPVAGLVVSLLVKNRPRQRPARRPLRDEGSLEWRASRTSLLLCSGAYVIAVLAASAATVSSGDWYGAPLAAVVLAWLLFPWWPQIAIQNGHLMVRNLRTRRVPLASVLQARAGYSGVEFALISGERLTAWASQKSNFAYMRGSTTRADQIGDVIVEHARRHREMHRS